MSWWKGEAKKLLSSSQCKRGRRSTAASVMGVIGTSLAAARVCCHVTAHRRSRKGASLSILQRMDCSDLKGA